MRSGFADAPRLQGNPVAAPDLSRAERHRIVFGDGMMGAMPSQREHRGMFWTVNGKVLAGNGHAHERILDLARGRSYVLELVNDTSWHHPIHLHGHVFRVLQKNTWGDTVLIDPDGRAKVTDFGIARSLEAQGLTATGRVLGTTDYVSPEQALGHEVTGQSDIYSLGIVLYQMVTGRKPFIEDEQKSVMHKIRLEKFPGPRKLNPEIPRELERIMARCMEKLPRDRYRSTQDLVLAFERFLSRRVEMNYHARVVLFLKNQGVITPEEAELESKYGEGEPPADGTIEDLQRRLEQVPYGRSAEAKRAKPNGARR